MDFYSESKHLKPPILTENFLFCRIPSFDYAALQAKTMDEMYFGAWSKSWLLSLWCSIIERGNTTSVKS
ncbi:hypothetical protein BpHYR1_028765 [Brachionus plicatilis]|uniref:Uncharacterized protein n=1 Tax=Brachionus plicatilis TaxID=10195 RepID=A0A3M7RSX9_BRAPC|nr:hypothetical protein BpHYR1_028765 [Brachionus plicatilis]